MSDTLEIRVSVDAVLVIPFDELENAFGTKDTEVIRDQVTRALEVKPSEGDTQTEIVSKWFVDNEPDFDVHGVQATWR